MSLGPHSHTKCSLVIPVHNQYRLIYKHLTTLLDKVQNPIEIIIINDASTDNTHRQILDFFESLSNDIRHSIKYYKTRIPVYESRCDDFGIRISNSKYVIEIQADMLIHEEAFDEKLLNIMEYNTDYAILSCRGVTDIKYLGNVKNIIKGREINDSIFMILYRNIGLRYLRKLIFRKIKLSPKNNPLKKSSGSQMISLHPKEVLQTVFTDNGNGVAGWLGDKINLLPYTFDVGAQIEISKFAGKIWQGETVMRGPIIMRKSSYLQVGGFNLLAFYQGLDDHDLCIRLKNLDMKVGFTPIYFSSPTALGSARNNRRLISSLFSKLNKQVRKQNIFKSKLYLELKTSPN